MRESRRTEKMRLPGDAVEIWLMSQTPKAKAAHVRGTLPKDSLEAWVEKRVAESLRRKKGAA